MQPIMLEQSGSSPIRFDGTEEHVHNGHLFGGKTQNRYHVLRLYRTRAGKYVLSVEYVTHWRGELGHKNVYIATSPRELASLLTHHDCLAYVKGFPDEERYQARQTRLLVDIKRRFESQVSALFGMREEFAETIS